MKRLLNLIERNVERNMITKLEYIKDFHKKEYSRDIYVNGGVYIENKIELVFLIDTGDLFYKTIRFDVTINTSSNMISVRKGYGDLYINYEKNKYKEIEDYIRMEVNKFYFDNRVDIEKKINKRKIV